MGVRNVRPMLELTDYFGPLPDGTLWPAALGVSNDQRLGRVNPPAS